MSDSDMYIETTTMINHVQYVLKEMHHGIQQKAILSDIMAKCCTHTQCNDSDKINEIYVGRNEFQDSFAYLFSC